MNLNPVGIGIINVWKKHIEEWSTWGLFQWCPKIALKRNKPGATHHSEHLIFENGKLMTFGTRKKAREYANKTLGYIKTRPDLKGFPHFWRLPIPVRITGILWRKP